MNHVDVHKKHRMIQCNLTKRLEKKSYCMVIVEGFDQDNIVFREKVEMDTSNFWWTMGVIE